MWVLVVGELLCEMTAPHLHHRVKCNIQIDIFFVFQNSHYLSIYDSPEKKKKKKSQNKTSSRWLQFSSQVQFIVWPVTVHVVFTVTHVRKKVLENSSVFPPSAVFDVKGISHADGEATPTAAQTATQPLHKRILASTGCSGFRSAAL